VPFLQELLGLTDLTGEQWFQIIVAAFMLLLVEEVIKFFLRRRRGQDVPTPMPATTAPQETY
jgi:Ca2+-transporting ATPase